MNKGDVYIGVFVNLHVNNAECVCVFVTLIQKCPTILFVQTVVSSDFNPLNSCFKSFSRPGKRESASGEAVNGFNIHLGKSD